MQVSRADLLKNNQPANNKLSAAAGMEACFLLCSKPDPRLQEDN